jgi:hypothetical protein
LRCYGKIERFGDSAHLDERGDAEDGANESRAVQAKHLRFDELALRRVWRCWLVAEQSSTARGETQRHRREASVDARVVRQVAVLADVEHPQRRKRVLDDSARHLERLHGLDSNALGPPPKQPSQSGYAMIALQPARE